MLCATPQLRVIPPRALAPSNRCSTVFAALGAHARAVAHVRWDTHMRIAHAAEKLLREGYESTDDDDDA